MLLPPHLSLHLLLLSLVLSCISAHPRNPSLATHLIHCPCTFTVSRPISDNTPFTIIIRTPTHPLPDLHPLSQRNLTNRHAIHNTSTTAFFNLHIPNPARHAITIHSQTTHFQITHVTHTNCPVLLEPDPPGLFRQNIVGGASASSDLQDFLAYLHNPTTGRACTGTVVAPRWIITAAHCDVTLGHIAYLRGDQARQGVPYEIDRVFPHDGFNNLGSAKFDIAIVQLVKVVTRSSFMQVSINSQIPIPASAARVLGYGSVTFDSPSGGVLFGQLRQVDVPVVTHAECVAAYTNVDQLHQVCAGYLGRGGCDSCQGDSGGPLIQYDDNGEPVLVALVSRGFKCGEARYPGIYIRLGAFEGYLDRYVGSYKKANSTRAVLAVTRSSKATFRNVLVPVLAVCGGVLGIGVVILIIVKIRRRQRRKGLKEIEESGNEDSGSTNDKDGMKQWQGQRVRQGLPIVAGGTTRNRPTMEGEQLPGTVASRTGNVDDEDAGSSTSLG